MGQFFKIFPNLSQNWLNFNKILEKSGDFAQNLAQNWTDWFMNGSLFFFVEKLVFVLGLLLDTVYIFRNIWDMHKILTCALIYIIHVRGKLHHFYSWT